jgi:NADH:ubiquinone oxidoreductase subunit 6 (subunit J)
MFLKFILISNYFFVTIVIFCKNSLYSIIGLVFLIVGCCLILFMLKVEFLTFILLLIYIGAISVLFLFVLMMLKLNHTEKLFIKFSNNYLIYVLLVLKLSCFFIYFNKKLCFSISFFSFEFLKYNKDINNSFYFLFENQNDSIFFLNLFSQKFLFFVIIGFILLFSMVSSIALCQTK